MRLFSARIFCTSVVSESIRATPSVEPTNTLPRPHRPAATAACIASGAPRNVRRAASALGVTPCSTSVTAMALNILDSRSSGTLPVISRKAMSPRLTWPRISPGRSLPRTTMRSALDQPSSERMGLRAISRKGGSLLGFHPGGGDHLGPLGDLAFEELRRLLGRAADRLDAYLVEAVLDLRLVDRLLRLGREPVDDVARRAG